MSWENDNAGGGDAWVPLNVTSVQGEGFTPALGGDEGGGFQMNGNYNGGEDGAERRGGGSTCHNCGQEGHFSKECNEPRKMKCRNCDQEGHLAKECPEPKKMVCRGCNEEGHAQRDCPQSPCRFCNEEGHVFNDCPIRLAIPCKKCQKPGHLAIDCESKTRTEDTTGIVSASIEEAWGMLKQASDENDLDAFKDAFFIYVKACPNATFAELDGGFRRENMVYNLVAIEKEIAPTQTIVDLQGNEDKKYAVTFQKGLAGRRTRLAKDGRYPKDNDENVERLADAGFVKESFELLCHNCNEKGHSSRTCPAEAQEKVSQQPEIKCINCDAAGHRARDCTQERKPRHDPNACRNCGKPGHTSRECEEPRDPSTMQCRRCEQMGHMSKDCPDAPKRVCHNCGEEGHGKQDCTNERVPICRNCDERGHMSRDCPQPQDPMRIKCRRCEQMGHRERDCQGEARPQEDAALESNNYGSNDYTNNGKNDASGQAGQSWQNDAKDAEINATWDN